jgi:hypothetical protein
VSPDQSRSEDRSLPFPASEGRRASASLARAGGRAASVRLSPAACPAARRRPFGQPQEDPTALSRGRPDGAKAQGTEARRRVSSADPNRGAPERALVCRLRPRPALGRSTLPDPQCDRRRHQGMPGRDRGHLDLWAARRPRTRRRRRLARQAGLDRLRPWNRVHLERNACLVAGAPDRLAFHRAGQADAERDLRSVQRPHARRTAQRDDLLRSRLRPRRLGPLDCRLQPRIRTPICLCH